MDSVRCEFFCRLLSSWGCDLLLLFFWEFSFFFFIMIGCWISSNPFFHISVFFLFILLVTQWIMSLNKPFWKLSSLLIGLHLTVISSSAWKIVLYFLLASVVFVYLTALDFSCCTWDLWSFIWRMWDLVPWPRIEPGPPTLGVWSLSHWTTRAFPGRCSFFFFLILFYF